MESLTISAIDQFVEETKVETNLLELARQELSNNQANLFKADYRFKKQGTIVFQNISIPCTIMFDSGAQQTHIGKNIATTLPIINNLHGTSTGAHGEAVPSNLYFFDLQLENGPMLKNIVAFTCDGDELIIGMDVLSKLESRIYKDGDTAVWEFDTASFDSKGIIASEVRFK